MEEVTLTIPQVITVIVLLIPIIVKMVRKPQMIEIDIPKEEVKEEPQRELCAHYGAVIQNASVYH